MNLKKYFEYAKSIGFEEVEFKTRSTKQLSVGVFHQNVENYEVSSTEIVSIRGIIFGNMVSAVTENTANICKMLDQMKENASLIDVKKEQELFAGSEKYRRMKNTVNEMAAVSDADKIAMCMELEKKCYAYDERIKDVRMVRYSEVESALSIENSKGLKLKKKNAYSSVMAMVIAREGSDTRTGSDFIMGQKVSDFDLDKIAENACKGAVSSLNGEQCRSGKYKTVLSNDVFASFLGYFLSAADGDAVNKGKSMLKDSLGQVVAGKKITITEDPFTTEFPFMARAFDDEGVATSRKAIVKDGVLNTFLYTIESAKEAGVQPTGNGYGSAGIHAGTSFLSVKPGRRDLDGLASTMKKGILITSVAGIHAGMNAMSGNFSLQANGYLIEDGKISTPVNLITIAGNLFEMFKEITEVGNDRKLTSSGIYAPSVVVKKLAVSGK